MSPMSSPLATTLNIKQNFNTLFLNNYVNLLLASFVRFTFVGILLIISGIKIAASYLPGL